MKARVWNLALIRAQEFHDDIDPAIMSRCGGYTGMEANQALGLSYHAIRVWTHKGCPPPD